MRYLGLELSRWPRALIAVVALCFIAATPTLARKVPPISNPHAVAVTTSATSIQPPPKFLVQIESQPIRLQAEDGSSSIKDWSPAVVALLSLLGALSAVWISARNTKRSIDASLESTEKTIAASVRNADRSAAASAASAEAAIWQRANEVEIVDLQDRLDKFYGPLVLRLGTVHLIAQELRSRQDINKYRLLLSLFDKQWMQALSPGDTNLVAEICEQDRGIEKFIRTNVQMTDEDLRPHLSRAVAHFRVLDLAFKGQLGDDPGPYQRYVYPEHLDSVLKLEIDRLRGRIAYLRANPATKPPPMPPLEIPAKFALRPWPNPERAVLPQPPDA